MREPRLAVLRLTHMTPAPARLMATTLGAAVALTVLLAGCAGGAESVSAPAPEEHSQATDEVYDGCSADDRALAAAEPLVLLDLLGDGTTEQVSLVADAQGSACGTGLILDTSAGTSGVRVEVPIDPDSVQLVDLVGTDRQLMMVSEPAHPRGGFAVHLFGDTGNGIGEVTLASMEPVLPFVATDGGALPVTAECRPDGQIAIVSAAPREPRGAMVDDGVLKWDVSTTTYSIDGVTAVEESSTTTRQPVADAELRSQRPHLFHPGAYFADCVVPAGL